ncbi:MAG TPA: MOSC N-terminal beta barrel domain-containing protein [Pseudonocardia sp.]
MTRTDHPYPGAAPDTADAGAAGGRATAGRDATLTAIHRYPVKSCRGHAVSEACVRPWGLDGDRRWALIDADGVAVTARTVPGLVLVRPEIVPGGLVLHADGAPTLAVAEPGPGVRRPVRVHAATVPALPAAEEADAWFSRVLGVPLRLVFLDDPMARRPPEDYSRPDDRVSLADGFALLLTTRESLDALNDLVVADRPEPEQAGWPLPMARFRPNVVVSGQPAWVEDSWRRVRIGGATFRMVKSCARCVLTTVHPDTAIKGKEPLRTLARHRRWGDGLWFGVNLTPDTPGAVIRLGDPVEVLERVESLEPLR